MSDAQSPPILLGSLLPDVDVWSDRVAVALGQNPSAFTGPGTNTYLVGTGPRRILLDAGDGREEYLPVLEQAMERVGCEGIDEIVLTHGHPDHIGGVESVMKRFGEVLVHKRPWPDTDVVYPFEISPIDDGSVIKAEGATLRAIYTPGHCPDHLCFILEEEQAAFSGDNVLGIGTTVIPAESGSLLEYMDSLARLEGEEPTRIYPAHGPCIQDGRAKVGEYIEHRLERERQILDALGGETRELIDIVRAVYVGYPEALYPAAGQSVTSHLVKLEEEGRVSCEGHSVEGGGVLEALWKRS
ncbi:MAG: beta-lactamase-like protein 2 [Myxococcota bacterium]|jgi:glyoxylase-like metal-dependent hydrolase (beta-lactamase superfamily II)|nr:beta-lactamase-like protein 2 [Myxococcota bacterium]